MNSYSSKWRITIPLKKVVLAMRNYMSTIFLQQILSGKLLLVVIIGAKK